jgi:hypothetical protein
MATERLSEADLEGIWQAARDALARCETWPTKRLIRRPVGQYSAHLFLFQMATVQPAPWPLSAPAA